MKQLLTLILTGFTVYSNAQFPDTEPQHYNVEFASEFDGNISGTLSTREQLQTIRPYWNWWTKNETNICNRYEYFQGEDNIEVTADGTLKIWLDKRDTPIVYSYTDDCTTTEIENFNPPRTRERIYNSEWLLSQGRFAQRMNYGYYEMRVKVPFTQFDANGNSLTEGIGFGWWTYQPYQNITSKNSIWDAELDFIELNGWEQRFTHQVLAKVPDGKGGKTALDQNEINFKKILEVKNISLERYANFLREDAPFNSRDSDGFHIMSCEVTPQKITWYMDGKWLQSTTGNWGMIKALPLLPYWQMEIGIATVPGHNADLNDKAEDKPSQYTAFPYIIEIDYVRYYKFACDDLTTKNEDASISLNYPIAELEDKVYKSIAIGNACSSTPRVLNGMNVSLRAVDYVELLPGFEVEIGGEFYADAHDCGTL